MQNKIWYLQVNEKKEGPFSVIELKCHPYFSPDALVMKEGDDHWTLARHLPELKYLFDDSEDLHEQTEKFLKPWQAELKSDDDILELNDSNGPFMFYWVIIIIIIFSYLYYRLYW